MLQTFLIDFSIDCSPSGQLLFMSLAERQIAAVFLDHHVSVLLRERRTILSGLEAEVASLFVEHW